MCEKTIEDMSGEELVASIEEDFASAIEEGELLRNRLIKVGFKLVARNGKLAKAVEVLESEALVNRHLAVCCHNLLAQYGNDDDKQLFATELGYGRDNMSVSEICRGCLQILAEAGNKNAQTGKADFYPHPELDKIKQ